jgi:hypothetical protein
METRDKQPNISRISTVTARLPNLLGSYSRMGSKYRLIRGYGWMEGMKGYSWKGPMAVKVSMIWLERKWLKRIWL